MAVRMEQNQKNGIELAAWLEGRPEVKKVLHPALPSNPGHDIWKRDFSGASGLFSFILKENYQRAALAAMLDGLELYGMGASWGGFESLIIPASPKDYRTAKWFEAKLKEDYEKPFFMAVGISKPHLPFYAPKEYFDLHPLKSVIVPEYRMDDLDDILNTHGAAAFKPHVDFQWCREYGVMRDVVQAYLAR